MLHFKPFKWLVVLIVIIFSVQKTRGFSISGRRNAPINENVKFQPSPNLGKIYRFFSLKLLSSHFGLVFLMCAFFLQFFCTQSIRIFSKNVIHAKLAFNVCRAFNVQLTFVCEIMKNRKFAIYHMVVMVIAVQLAAISPILVSRQLIIEFKMCGILSVGEFFAKIYQNMFAFFFSLQDNRNKKSGRSAGSDISTSIFKLMNAIVSEANEHLTGLDHHESEVATVNPHDQPEFMHNLLFR